MRAFTICDAPQRSEAWFAARLGRLTGSRASDALSTIKSGEAAARRNLRVQLVLERITGRCQDRVFTTPAMQDGIDREPEAYAYYEALTGEMLTRTGFLAHDTLQAGCSLDGHVGDFEALIEIKSPTPAIHLEYIRSGQVPGDYLKQVTHALWLTGAAWCDWMSYHPDFPEPLKAKIVRVKRDEAAIAAYEKAALTFLEEVQREYDAIRTLTEFPVVLKEVAHAV
jgi:hypothetical protein